MFRRFVGLLTVGAVLGSGLVAAPASAAEACADVVIIGARGTNQPSIPAQSNMGAESHEAALALEAALLADGRTVKLHGVDYPAEELRTVGAIGRIPLFQTYGGSANEGGNAVVEELQRIVDDCPPQTEAILVGYSQGADVMSRAVDTLRLDDLDAEKDRIAGVLLLGDPAFNPIDLGSAAGSHQSHRAGLWPRPEKWADVLDVPVVSYCRAMDLFCQGQKLVRYEQPSNGLDKQTWAIDFAPIISNAAAYYGYETLNNIPANQLIDPENLDRLTREHTSYNLNGNTVEAAALLLDKMGVEAPAFGSHERVQVALIIDSNAEMTDEIAELKSRAEEIVDLVLGNVRGSEVAVIDFKGGIVSADNPYLVNVGTDLSSNREAILDAIYAIEPGGGRIGTLGQPIGVGMSAEAAADNLDWTAGVRRLNLNLWGSRVCDARFCSVEDDTGFSWMKPDYFTEWKTLRGGVNLLSDPVGYPWSTSNNHGWHQTVNFPYFSDHPSSDPYWAIESFVARLKSNLTLYMYGGVSAPNTVALGSGAGVFDANSLIPFMPGSDRVVRWAHEWVDDGVDTRYPTSPFDLVGNPGDWGADPPPTMGTVFRPELDRPGRHNIAYVAVMDGQYHEGHALVTVPTPLNYAPRAPGYYRYTSPESETILWSGSDDSEYYEIRDARGEVMHRIVPVPEVQADGRVLHSYTSFADADTAARGGQPDDSLSSTGGGQPTISAVNVVGSTPGIPVLSAPEVSYQSTASGAGDGSDAVLTFSGISDDDLLQALQTPTPGVVDVAGDYSASFVSPSLSRYEVAMQNAVASIAEDEAGSWSLALELGNLATEEGTALHQLMDDGFAPELLFGGSVDLELEGTPIRITITPTADALDLSNYVISSDPPPTLQDEVQSASKRDENIELNYYVSPGVPLPSLFTGTPSGLKVFDSTSITNVRSYLGDVEVTNTFSLEIHARRGTRNAQIILIGDPAGGSSSAWKEFLSEGTLTFQVNGGATNVLGLRVSQEDSEALATGPAPELIGTETVVFKQGVLRSWSPVIDWKSEEPGYVYLDGQLPTGLSFDWRSNRIQGSASEPGIWPVTVYAESSRGQNAMLTYSIVVPELTELRN